jgi:PAS domain S-box-containing protein
VDRKTPYRFRAGGVLLIMYGISLAIMTNAGVISGGPAWLFCFSVAAGLLLGIRAALLAVGMNLITLVGLGYLTYRGSISAAIPFFDDINRAVTAFVNYSFLNIAAAMSAAVLVKGLENAGRKQREVAKLLLKEKEKAQQYIEIAPSIILALDASGNITLLNRHGADILECHPRDAIGKNWFDNFLPEDERASIRKGFEQLIRGEVESVERFENKVITAKGRPIYCRWLNTVIRDDSGKIVGTLGSAEDITERKSMELEKSGLEKQLHHNRKIEALGRMAGAIAHHFNNQLSVVLGNLEMVLDSFSGDELERDQLIQAMKAGRRAAEISGLMLTYLGQSVGKREPLDLANFCRQSLEMIKTALPSHLALQTDLPPSGPVVNANSNHLRLILTHLLTNAAEAIGGRQGAINLIIQIVTADEIPPAGLVPIDWKPPVEPFVCLRVTDTGCGMTEEEMDKIFDPFFTTKFTGRGLGLAVVLGIIKSWNGAIGVRSIKGRGSTFNIFLPQITDSCPLPTEKSALPMTVAPGDTILLVEDQDMVRETAASLLQRLGFNVVAAADGNQALDLYKAHSDRIRCMVTDLSMPGMDGWETLAAVRNIAPHLPVILVSGYEESQAMSTDHPQRPQAFLHKPYRLEEMAHVLSNILRRETNR